jgi:hypothetical protein
LTFWLHDRRLCGPHVLSSLSLITAKFFNNCTMLANGRQQGAGRRGRQKEENGAGIAFQSEVIQRRQTKARGLSGAGVDKGGA